MPGDRYPANSTNVLRSRQDGPEVSMSVPPLNEAQNIGLLRPRIPSAPAGAGLDTEILFVDVGSTDGTQACIEDWGDKGPVRLVESDAGRGLAGEVLHLDGLGNTLREFYVGHPS